MGGQSTGQLQQRAENGQWITCLQGEVRLENQGGFIQAQFDMSAVNNLNDFDGMYLTWRGQSPATALHLKTQDLRQPWQSYKCPAYPGSSWQTDYIAFHQFTPYRTGIPLNLHQVTRFSVLAIGQPGTVDLCIREFGLFKRK